MRVAVIQPSYIPWLGFFYILSQVDMFIYYDHVQFDKHGWRNRNRVECNGIPKWLTLSLDNRKFPKNLADRKLLLASLLDNGQFARHSSLLKQYYSGSTERDYISQLYPDCLSDSLNLVDSVINHNRIIAERLDITTPCYRSSSIDYEMASNAPSSAPSSLDAKNTNLLNLLTAVGATHYYSGLAAKAYLDETAFYNAGVRVMWNDFVNPTETIYSTVHYIIKHGPREVLGFLKSNSI